MPGWVNRPLRSTVIKRSCTRDITTYNGGTYLEGYDFKLSDLPNYSEFALYDQYRIDKITVHVLMDSNPISTFKVESSTPTGFYESSVPHLITCIDYDDATVPSLDSILEHQTCVIHGVLTPGKMYSRTFMPKSFAGNAIQTTWYDTLNGTQSHFGFKLAVVAGSATPLCKVYVYCDYYLSLRLPV